MKIDRQIVHGSHSACIHPEIKRSGQGHTVMKYAAAAVCMSI